MGVLDDAIREHIELQRLHGATEEELSRQEREALGPARRETPSPADEREPADAADDAPEAPVAESGVDFDRQRTQVLEQVDPEDFHEAPAPAEPEFAPTVDEDDLFGDDEPFAEPAAGPDAVDGEAVEEEEEDAVEEEEDVLEETPEFLQETPEHDRLWFEQKPPRDFDFDDK